MTELLLYGMGSPNVGKVVLMLEELGLPYELRHVSVLQGEQFTPEFRALNPLSKVPVLVDPQLGAPLAESGAILFWLAERSGAFLPTEPAPRQEVMQWLMIQMSSIGPMLGQLNHFNMLGPQQHPYAHARYRGQAERLYRLLDDRLADREWIAGGDYSIGDMAVHPWAHYLEKHGFNPAGFPALLRWRSMIDARPAAGRAAARMSEAFDQASRDSVMAASDEDLDRFFCRSKDMPATDFSVIKRWRV